MSCTATTQCTHHNVYCTAPDCAYGRARRKEWQDGKTHHDPAAEMRVRDAEAAVVAAAEAWYEDRTSERELAVLAAVRALREVRGCR